MSRFSSSRFNIRGTCWKLAAYVRDEKISVLIMRTGKMKPAITSSQKKPNKSARVDTMPLGNLKGLTDHIIRLVVDDLKEEDAAEQRTTIRTAFEGQEEDEEQMRSLRHALGLFVTSHPQAERCVARLVLKHVGFSPSAVRDAMYEGHMATSPLRRSASSSSNDGGLRWQDELILPALSPVSWLSDISWSKMLDYERTEFMQCACLNNRPSSSFLVPPPSSLVGADLGGEESLLSSEAASLSFRDRVVLGHGPRRVLVLVGIHGNEGCGVEAVRQILRRFRLFHGSSAADMERDIWWDRKPLSTLFDKLTIEFVLGNPKAYQASQRFIKKNLNRLFDEHLLCDDERAQLEGYEYELQRARIINESIRHSDFLLDIHSCSADVGSFALPTSLDLSEAFAKQMPVDYVVQSLAHMTFEGGTSLDAALLYGVPGACVECGKHDHPNVVARASAVISACLRQQYCCEQEAMNDDDEDCKVAPPPGTKPPIVMKCVTAERVHSGFEWIQKFPEFHHVPFKTPIFRDDVRGEVTCPYVEGARIVMPTEMPVEGEEALFWAVAAN
jgi:hypothetical protein